jgi:hypothetical protein
MSNLVSPIHVEAVGLGNLRFFAPPSGGREFPWLSIDDLHASMELPRSLRREFKTRLRTSEWKDATRTVATADGIVNIVPHFMAQGLIEAMHECGYVSEEFYGRYASAGATAMTTLTKDLPPSELLEYIGAAFKASGGAASDGDQH